MSTPRPSPSESPTAVPPSARATASDAAIGNIRDRGGADGLATHPPPTWVPALTGLLVTVFGALALRRAGVRYRTHSDRERGTAGGLFDPGPVRTG